METLLGRIGRVKFKTSTSEHCLAKVYLRNVLLYGTLQNKRSRVAVLNKQQVIRQGLKTVETAKQSKKKCVKTNNVDEQKEISAKLTPTVHLKN